MMTVSSTVRVAVLGGPKVGKSALTVRFLTRRFIGEYTSNTDFLYKYKTTFEDLPLQIEILDCARSNGDSVVLTDQQLEWADAFIIVYSICDRRTFSAVPKYIEVVQESKPFVPVLLLGNKTDLEHGRQVNRDEADDVAMEYGCQFHEVSAAECPVQVINVFNKLIREAKLMSQRRSSRDRRKNSLGKISKVISAMFGRGSNNNNNKDSSDKITVMALSRDLLK